MTSSDDTCFTGVAAAVAERIADAAIWSQGRCNWVAGAEAQASRSPGIHAVEAALGPDFYSGTSGVAVFLAEAALVHDDRRQRETALAALAHAVHHASEIDPRRADGFHTGRLGIAYAAARVADRLGVESALADARRVLRTWQRDRARSARDDIVAGSAGAVIALVALAESLDDSALVDMAAVLGDELIARAAPSPVGWSWASPRGRAMWNLCGYSHGAAGIGHALLELFAATGEARFRLAGERAYAYERSWFEPRSGTWPDLRGIARRARPGVPTAGMESWCNGAAGIALSRLRAARLVDSDPIRRDAELAVAATARAAAALVDTASEDFSLCHGAAGIGDALLYCTPPSPLAAAIGRFGVERHGPAGFPCGVPRGWTPCLFLGEAGIGLFYLRLLQRGIRSPLIVHS